MTKITDNYDRLLDEFQEGFFTQMKHVSKNIDFVKAGPQNVASGQIGQMLELQKKQLFTTSAIIVVARILVDILKLLWAISGHTFKLSNPRPND